MENKDKIPKLLKSFYLNIDLHSDLSVLGLSLKINYTKKRKRNEVMMMKGTSKESGYSGIGGIPKTKEKDRHWGGCRKEILESGKY